jgi:hypothetical protein
MSNSSKHLYNGFVTKLGEQIDAALAEIETVHNFEFGPEFEIALCKVLRRILPNKYGVCRGYAVDEGG